MLPIAGAVARGLRHRGLAADRADAGPGRGPLEAGVNAAVLNSTLSYAEASEVERRLLARRSRRALCRAGAVADAALPRLARRRPKLPCLRSTRRIACRNGATISARNTSAHSVIARALSQRAAHRADGDRRRADAAGDRRAARSSRTRRSSSRVSTGRISDMKSSTSTTRKTQLKSFISERHAGDAGIVYCLSRAKVEDTAACADQSRRRRRCPITPASIRPARRATRTASCARTAW